VGENAPLWTAPRPTPTPLLRLREGVYAADLAVAAIAFVDVSVRPTAGDRSAIVARRP
jgi:hypothetical protein